MQGMRIIFIFEHDRLRIIRALVRNEDEQRMAAGFLAKIASAVQPDTMSTAVDSGDAHGK